MAQSLIVTPSPLDFGNTTVNATKSETVTVSNFSGTGISIESLYLAGHPAFSRKAGTCPSVFPASLAGNSACTVIVEFTAPSTIGSYSSTLNLVSDTGNTSVSLSASVVGSGTPPTISPAIANFGLGNAASANPSAAFSRLFTLTNVSSTPLSLISYAGSPWSVYTTPYNLGSYYFSPGPDAASSCFEMISAGISALRRDALAPGQSCTFSVSFNGTQPNNYDTTITLVTNQGNTSFEIKAAIGTVSTPIAVTPDPISFSALTAGNRASQTVTLTNPSASAAQIYGLSGPIFNFSIVPGGTCPSVFPASLAGNSACTVIVEFTAPSTIGPYSSTLNLVSNTGNTSVSLSASVVGSGTPPTISPTISPAIANFGLGNAASANPSAAFGRLFTLTNVSSTPLSLISYAGSPWLVSTSPFEGSYYFSPGPDATSSCFEMISAGISALRRDALAPGQSCTFSVSFNGTQPNNYDTTITLVTNQGNTSFEIKAAIGTVEYPIQVTPTSLTLSRVSVGLATNVGTLTLRNPAPVQATIWDLNIPAPFQRTGGTCATIFPAVLAVGASCTVDLVVPAGARSVSSGDVGKALVSVQLNAPLVADTGNVDVGLNLVTGEDESIAPGRAIPTQSPVGLATLVLLLLSLAGVHSERLRSASKRRE